jgi:hypothetical protein
MCPIAGMVESRREKRTLMQPERKTGNSRMVDGDFLKKMGRRFERGRKGRAERERVER